MLAALDTMEVETIDLLKAAAAVQTASPAVILLETADAADAKTFQTLQLADKCGAIPLLVLCNHADVATVRHGLRAGVRGYVLKTASSEELLFALQSVARGKKYVGPEFIDWIVWDEKGDDRAKNTQKPLSTREAQVLCRLVQGCTGSEIARELQVSTKTIETYRSRIYEKPGLHSRVEMMRYAASVGLLSFNATAGLELQARHR